MRGQIDGLAARVEEVLGEGDPVSSHPFVFCYRARDKVNVWVWYRTGWCLWYRRPSPSVRPPVVSLDPLS